MGYVPIMYHSGAMERPGSVLELAKSALRRFDEERCFQLAGSLTYTTLLALVPLMTVVLSLGTMFPLFRDWMAHLDVWFEKNVSLDFGTMNLPRALRMPTFAASPP